MKFELSATRRPWPLALLGILALLAPMETARADPSDALVIIVNARNPTQNLSKADIKKMFLGQVAFWHGVVPIKVVSGP